MALVILLWSLLAFKALLPPMPSVLGNLRSILTKYKPAAMSSAPTQRVAPLHISKQSLAPRENQQRPADGDVDNNTAQAMDGGSWTKARGIGRLEHDHDDDYLPFPGNLFSNNGSLKILPPKDIEDRSQTQTSTINEITGQHVPVSLESDSMEMHRSDCEQQNLIYEEKGQRV